MLTCHCESPEVRWRSNPASAQRLLNKSWIASVVRLHSFAMTCFKITPKGINMNKHNEELQNPESQRKYLNLAIKELIEHGDYNIFFKSLEQVVKTRYSMTEFSKRCGITRKALYDMFKGERVPRLDTLSRIFKELGYELQVA